MPGEPEKAEMAELKAWLEMRKNTNNPAALFLGARAGGLYRSHQFYDTLKPFSKLTMSNLPLLEQFRECYRLLNQHQFSESDRYSILTNSLSDARLTDADICLAEMVKDNKLFDVIISTNIDDLLEDAFGQVGMKEFFDYDVFIPERTPSEAAASPIRSHSCKVIKSFGALSSRMYSITERGAYLDANPSLTTLLETHLARDVLVIGLDVQWDQEMMRMFPTHGGTLWFVNEEVWTPHHTISHIGRGRQVKYIEGQENNHENFWKMIHWYLNQQMPSNFQLTYNLRREIQSLRHEIYLLKEDHQNMHKDLKVLMMLLQTHLNELEKRE